MKSRILRSCLGAFTLLVSGLILTGCAYNRAHLAGGKTLSIERVHSEHIFVSWVYVEEENNDVVITGWVRRYYPSSKGSGHVDVAIVAPSGDLVGQSSVPYVPETIPGSSRSGGSRFEARFPVLPPDGAKIRLAFHPGPASEEKLLDCGKNLAVSGLPSSL
jgi:hypothetical protein